MEAEEPMEHSPGIGDDVYSDDMEPTESVDVKPKTSGPQAISLDGVTSERQSDSDNEQGEESMEEGEVDDSEQMPASSNSPGGPCSISQDIVSPSRDECSVSPDDISHSTGVERFVKHIPSSPDSPPPPIQENKPQSFSEHVSVCSEEISHQPASPEDIGLASEDEEPASPDDAGPISPKDDYPVVEDVDPASPEESPVSPEDESPQSPLEDESPQSPEDESPQSPEDEGPASPDYEEPTSPVEEPTSPVEEEPTSPVDEGPTSPVDEVPTSPVDEEPTSPVDEGPTSPVDEGLVSSEDEGPASPDDEGLASPDDEGLCATSPIDARQVSSEDEEPSVNSQDVDCAGSMKTGGISKTHDSHSVAVGGGGSVKSCVVQDTSDLSHIDSCSVKQEPKDSAVLVDKENQESDEGSYHSDCSAPASPISEGELCDDMASSVNEDRTLKCVLSSPRWPTNIASSPISDTEEIWDDPAITDDKVSTNELPVSIENVHIDSQDDSGMCVKTERRVSFIGDSKFNIKAEIISRTVRSTISQPSLDISKNVNTIRVASSDSVTENKRKIKKETGIKRCIIISSPQAAKLDISSTTDTVHGDCYSRHKLDRHSLSKDRSARFKEHKRDKDSIHKHVDGLSETVAVAESATRDDAVNEGRIRKEKENTSFNEEHVELDYEEDVADEMHGHHNDISKEEDEDGETKKDGSEDEKQEGEITDDEDDGEIEEEEDCEEGEIREPGMRRQSTKPICRFFLRGSCTWGLNCRFLHPGINDKGNYRLIEMPGFNRMGGPMGPFGPIWGPEMPEEPEPPPPPELPPTESAWERGLRHAKELRKKAQEKKEHETDFEEKRLNLTLDEERELNKENERNKFSKDPYYDQPAFEDDEYYNKPQVAAWQPGQYENFEVRWTRGPEYPPFREEERPSFKERNFSLHMDRVERPVYPPRQRHDRRHEKWHHDRAELANPPKHLPKGRQADEWHDPWQRTKSPISRYRGSRSDSRGRRRSRRSYSISSRGSSSSYSTSRSRSSSASSRSSRSSYSRSSSFSSRSPTPPGTTRPNKNSSHDSKKQPAASPRVNTFSTKVGEKKPTPPVKPAVVKPSRPPEKRLPAPSKSNEQPRSAVSMTVKQHKQRYPDKPIPTPPTHSPVKQARPPQIDVNNRARRPDKAQPPVKVRTRSGSSTGSSQSHSSSSSFSRSRSRSASSMTSRSSSTGSTTSSGSADSDHLYRDLQKGQNGDQPVKKVPDEKKPHKAPKKEVRRPRAVEHQSEHKPRRTEHRPSRQSTESRVYNSAAGYRHQSGRAPTTPVKPKDPMKLVGQKQSIKLLLVNKGSEKASSNVSGLSTAKRRASEQGGPPAKRPSASVPTVNKPVAVDKATKPTSAVRSEKAKSPIMKMKTVAAQPKAPLKPPTPTKAPAPTKPAVPAQVPAAVPEKPKIKKSTLSRREELLKQLKAVEDAIARKKSKMT